MNDFFKDKVILTSGILHITPREGYEFIANIAGGLVEWERDDLPVKINKSEHLKDSCMCMLRKRNIKYKK
ncbi:MAG: hypothetical protein CVT99_06230 [Bacteroidetes bacterium HGW-Bacteroidetes-16]|jgi:hypothetical protein|nr:MAG: hypothetical protein CVT99_06230 [Bacteroidetes bacterium HGW-Bacteroidetes-16]